jgi:hypothetical protein
MLKLFGKRHYFFHGCKLLFWFAGYVLFTQKKLRHQSARYREPEDEPMIVRALEIITTNFSLGLNAIAQLGLELAYSYSMLCKSQVPICTVPVWARNSDFGGAIESAKLLLLHSMRP